MLSGKERKLPAPGLGEQELCGLTGAEISHQIRTCLPKLLAYSKHLVGSTGESEDVVHDVLSALLLRNRDEGFWPDDIEAWCVRAIRNRTINIWKKRARVQVLDIRLAGEAELLHDDIASNPEDKLSLENCLEARTLEHREVLLLFGFGYTYQEISDLCGIAKGTIMSRLSRARQSLDDGLKGLEAAHV